MISVSKVRVQGWEPAIRGARNPMNSWSKSDTDFSFGAVAETAKCGDTTIVHPIIGANDLNLLTRLANAGPDHGKFMRMITVYMDINAPLYWWKEFDTYKVGTVANSCSTMHKIHDKEFTLDDFSHEHLSNRLATYVRGTNHTTNYDYLVMLEQTIGSLNLARTMFLVTKDKEYWWQMIQLLPSSYNQLRTVELNYEVVKRMYHARKSHKLDEWRTLCGEFEKLPYARELIIGGTKK